jgi:hypothetical protein
MSSAVLLDRRRLLRFGSLSLGGLMLPAALTAAARRPVVSCILLYMDGGPSHIDLWDLKPNAPEEIRGPFQPLATSVPGVRVCEHLPRTATRMHLLAQVRSVRHTETIHDPAVYQMLTGHKHPISAGGLTVQPTDQPQLGAAFGKVVPASAAMPQVIELPETMKMEARVLPGQNAGFLGAAYDPFRVSVTPNAEVVPPDFQPCADVPSTRLEGRTTLLRQLERQSGGAEFEQFRRQALALLDQPQVRQAFDLDREPEALRRRYGRHRHGQSVLLARRLVEAGARFVTVYWGRELQDWADGKGLRPANNPWDTHRNHFLLLRDDLLPRADQALSSLLDDLDVRGTLGQTLVVWMGDFGRTPCIDRKYASRDHWPHANTVLFAGAGVPGGAVIGRTDSRAGEVTDHPVTPADLCATILTKLGVDPRTTIHDVQGRPHPLCDGTAIAELFG